MAKKVAALPLDANVKTVPIPPALVSKATTVDSSISSATALTLQESTTLLEIIALNAPVCVKWGAGPATASDFDIFVMADTKEHHAIVQGGLALSIIEYSTGATVIVIER